MKDLNYDFSGLEQLVDAQLEKTAQSVLGEARSAGGAVAQMGLYATPIVGSALSIADGLKDFRHGHIGAGLSNLGLGVITGIADLGSFGTLGSGIRGAAAAARAARAAKIAARAAKAGGEVARASRAAKATATAARAARPGLVGRAARWVGRNTANAVEKNKHIMGAANYLERNLAWATKLNNRLNNGVYKIMGGNAQSWGAARASGRSRTRAAGEWLARRANGIPAQMAMGQVGFYPTMPVRGVIGGARTRYILGDGTGVLKWVGNGGSWDPNNIYKKTDPNYQQYINQSSGRYSQGTNFM